MQTESMSTPVTAGSAYAPDRPGKCCGNAVTKEVRIPYAVAIQNRERRTVTGAAASGSVFVSVFLSPNGGRLDSSGVSVNGNRTTGRLNAAIRAAETR